MSLLYPSFLFALFALAIPIIIHLFNFRKFKRIYFTNVALLQEVQQETKSRRNLKHLLVLIARLLALTFLVLAFAQPYIPAATGASKQGLRVVSVYVDNSFSMSSVGDEGELLQAAKNKAREIATAYSSSDFYQLLTADFEGKHQRLVSKEDFLRQVDEINVSPASRSLSEIVARQREALNKEPYLQKTAYILSDFQKSMMDVDAINADTTITTELVRLKANPKPNLSIDSVWMETPFVKQNQTAQLMVRVRNFGGEAQENVPLTLKINGVQKGLANFSVGKDEAKNIELPFTSTTAGWQNAEVEVTDDPITFDDKLYFAFEVKQEIKILGIYPETPDRYLAAVYADKDNYFALTQVSDKQLDYSSFSNFSLIVLQGVKTISSGLSQELDKYVKSGGSVAIFPPSVDALDPTINEFLKTFGASSFGQPSEAAEKVSYTNTEHPILSLSFKKVDANMDKPAVERYFPALSAGTAREDIMRLQNGQPFLSSYAVQGGKVYVFDSPLDGKWNNLNAHALFIPVMINMALNSVTQPDLFYTIGSGQLVRLNVADRGKDQVYKMARDKQEIIPQVVIKDNKINLAAGPELKEPGNYSVSSGSTDLGVRVAYNYNRHESDNSYYTETELADRLKNSSLRLLDVTPKGLKEAIINADRGIELWRYCIMIALVFLLFEILLLRFLK